ncbi:BBL_G0054850.mRNA.1.CDS.1 [Saccharomyces cerevisiae]|nr:BBL_G0054850.mRNA.1.CDS.1 [Saccharomyces cerevisiae]CAI7382228.1 BBL_G0054850.mRNA.1.CDS.1 [Saccharomyces cerevisiae]
MSSYLRHCSSRLPGKTCSRERNNFPLRLSGGISGEGIHPGFPIRMVQYAALALSTCCFSARDMDIDAPRGVSFLGIKWLAANQTRGMWDGSTISSPHTHVFRDISRTDSFFFFFFFFCFPRNRNLSISRRKRVGQILEQILWGERILGQMQKRNGRNKRARTFLRRIFLYIIQNIFSKLLNLLIDLNRPSGNKTL